MTQLALHRLGTFVVFAFGLAGSHGWVWDCTATPRPHCQGKAVYYIAGGPPGGEVPVATLTRGVVILNGRCGWWRFNPYAKVCR